MNTKYLLATATLSLISLTTVQAGNYFVQQTEQDYQPDMLEMYYETERAAARYHDEPPTPHWTDMLKKEQEPDQPGSFGLSYGGEYGSTGSIRPAAEQRFGTVAVYYRAVF